MIRVASGLRVLALGLWGGAPAVLCAGPALAEDPKLDLELFSQEELGEPPACAVRLWQAGLDPDTDRYAVVFHEALDADHTRAPARIVIGGEIVELERVATGGATTGYDLHPEQAYRSRDGKTRALLELEIVPEEGEAVGIDGGRMIVIRSGYLPFTVAVEGDAGCLTPPAAGEDLTDLFAPYEIGGDSVPESLIAAANEAYECDWRDALMRSPVTAFQTSEEGAVWDMSCAAGMHNVGHVVAQVYIADPNTFSLMSFQDPPGRSRPSPHVLFNATWDAATRTVTAFASDRGLGDCGTFERHRYVDGEFVLVEYREKPECDGTYVEPEDYPLVYSR